MDFYDFYDGMKIELPFGSSLVFILSLSVYNYNHLRMSVLPWRPVDTL